MNELNKSIFEVIRDFAIVRGVYNKDTNDAINWYKNEISKLSGINKLKLLGDNIQYQSSRPTLGTFAMWFYSSKGYKEKTLPYYDKFPIVLLLGIDGKYCEGLNWHYLPYTLRAKLLKDLIDIEGGNISEQRKLSATYESIKEMTNLYKPCYHKYLISHIKSRVLNIPPDSVVPSIFLPVASWAGTSESKVWSDSRKKI